MALRTVAPALFGTVLLAGLFAPDRALHPAALALLAAFIAHFGWRIHALAADPRPSDVDRAEVGLLAVLALSTVLEVTAPPAPWPIATYGVLLVGLASSVPLPGILALPPAAVSLWEPGFGWLTQIVHLELLAAAAGTVVTLEQRRRRKLELALNKLQLDDEHLASRSRSAGATPGRELARLDDVLYRYLAEVKENADAHGAVLAVRSTRGPMYVRELVSDSHNIRENAVLNLQGTTFQWILSNRKPLRIGRLQDPAARLGYYSGQVAVRSFLGVPVMEGEQVEGVLAVDQLREEAFNDAHLTMLKVASHQVATILDQIQALERVKREARDFKHLHEFSKRLAACGTTPELLDLLLASARERMAPDFSAVGLLTGEGEVCLRAVGEDRWAELRDQTFAPGEGLAGWVLASRNYLHYEESRERARRPLFGRKVRAPDLRSLMLHPLTAHEETLGVLCLGSDAPRAFDPSAVAFSEVLAQQAAQGLLRIRMLEQLRDLATADGLTGLANRRVFFERLASEIPRSQRYEHGLALVLLDIDHFKKINDRFGHPAGDEVLRRVAQTLREVARETDLAARYGGEEFAVLLPATDEAGARAVAERLRTGIEALDVRWEDRAIPVRASVGLASLQGPDDAAEELVSRADRALYAAKEGGRNRVAAFSEMREYVSWA